MFIHDGLPLSEEPSSAILALLKLLIEKNIYISDFKMVNVMFGYPALASQAPRAYLVDFERASRYQADRQSLAKEYLRMYESFSWQTIDHEQKIRAFLESIAFPPKAQLRIPALFFDPLSFAAAAGSGSVSAFVAQHFWIILPIVLLIGGLLAFMWVKRRVQGIRGTTTSFSDQGPGRRMRDGSIRHYQEDRLVDATVDIPGIRHGRGRLMLIADGHGGHKVSQIVQDNVGQVFINELTASRGKVKKALTAIFPKLAQITTSQQDGDELDLMGTTVSLVYVPEDEAKVYVAVLGDSPVMIIDHKGNLKIGPEHKAGLMSNKERRAIVAKGGFFKPGGKFKVMEHPDAPAIAPMRTLGDYHFDKILGRTPDVYSVRLGERSVVLVSSDGLMDVESFKPQEEYLRQIFDLVEQGAYAAGLVQHALTNGSGDNVTAILFKVTKLWQRPFFSKARLQSIVPLLIFALQIFAVLHWLFTKNNPEVAMASMFATFPVIQYTPSRWAKLIKRIKRLPPAKIKEFINNLILTLDEWKEFSKAIEQEDKNLRYYLLQHRGMYLRRGILAQLNRLETANLEIYFITRVKEKGRRFVFNIIKTQEDDIADWIKLLGENEENLKEMRAFFLEEQTRLKKFVKNSQWGQHAIGQIKTALRSIAFFITYRGYLALREEKAKLLKGLILRATEEMVERWLEIIQLDYETLREFSYDIDKQDKIIVLQLKKNNDENLQKEKAKLEDR